MSAQSSTFQKPLLVAPGDRPLAEYALRVLAQCRFVTKASFIAALGPAGFSPRQVDDWVQAELLFEGKIQLDPLATEDAAPYLALTRAEARALVGVECDDHRISFSVTLAEPGAAPEQLTLRPDAYVLARTSISSLTRSGASSPVPSSSSWPRQGSTVCPSSWPRSPCPLWMSLCVARGE